MNKSRYSSTCLFLICLLGFLIIKSLCLEAGYSFTVEVNYEGGDPVPHAEVWGTALYKDNVFENVAGTTNNSGTVWLHLSRDKEDINKLTLGAGTEDKIGEQSLFSTYKDFYPPYGNSYSLVIPIPSTQIKHYYIGKGNSEAFSYAIITDSHIGYAIYDYGTTGWNDTPYGYTQGTAAEYLRREVNWINAHKGQYNIRFVIHIGDITDSAERSEFLKAKEILDDLEVPYIPIMGNHDILPYIGDEFSFVNAPPNYLIQFFQETFEVQFFLLSGILANWKKQDWPGSEKNENYYFDYMHYHFICQDYNSREYALLAYPGVKPEADLHGTGDWMLGHLNNYWNMGDDNVLLFAHHPLKVGEPHLFSFGEFDKIRCGLDPKRDNVYRWFAGHIHENNSWPIRDFWHTHEILDVIVTNQGFYEDDNPTIRIVHVKDNLYVAFDYTPKEPTTADVITFTNQSTYPNWFDWLK